MEEKLTCNKCKFYNPKTKICAVIIPLTMEMKKALGTQDDRLQLKPAPDDLCFYEQEFRGLDRDKMSVERFHVDVQQIKMWVEDAHGVKGKEGIVKIEYPEGLFPEGFIGDDDGS